MFPFDVILFDVGGVLLTNGWDRCERSSVLEQFHLDPGAFNARHPAAYDAWERDSITAKEYLDATVFYEPRSFSHDEILAAICAQSQWLPDGALGALEQLVASGKCLLGALNNEARETNEYRFRTFGLRAYFQFAFSSCYLGLRKPDPAIYLRALDILGKPSERILFIDDRTENLDGAAKAGMKTIHFTGAAALHADLVRLDVL
jgi:putative hydrolase of the HAD superfamily